MDKNIVWLDYAKVLGIFLVIFGHCLQRFPCWQEVYFVKSLWDYIYLFHMPLFFAISGYLFKNNVVNIQNVKHGWGKILKTILIPYLLYQFLFFPFALYSSHGFTDISIWEKLLCGILMGDGYETLFSHYVCLPCWFIICIFHLRLFFLVVPINKYTSVFITIFCIWFLIIRKHYDFDLYFCLDNTIMAIPYFLGGYYCGNKKILDRYNNTFLLIVLCIISAIAIWIILNINGAAQMIAPTYGKNLLINYMAGALGTLGIWSLSKMLANCFRNKNFIHTISRNTLFIIFFHWLLLMFIGKMIHKTFGDICTNAVSIIVVSLLLSLIILFFSKIVIDFGVIKYPFLFGKLRTKK